MSKPKQMFAMKTSKVTFKTSSSGVTDFSDAINTVRLNPSTSTNTVPVISGNTWTDSSAATWTLELGLVQDLDPQGLMRYLFDQEGKEVTVYIELAKGSDAITCTVIASPAAIGGSAGQIAQSSVTLAINGRPVWGRSGG